MLLLSDVHAQPLVAMERHGLLAALGADHLCGTLDEALGIARGVLAGEAAAPRA